MSCDILAVPGFQVKLGCLHGISVRVANVFFLMEDRQPRKYQELGCVHQANEVIMAVMAILQVSVINMASKKDNRSHVCYLPNGLTDPTNPEISNSQFFLW